MSQQLRITLAILLGVVIAYTGPTIASTIKTWSNGSTLTAADLNANFQHIHSTMVGGHGAKLVDADVSGSAAIAYTKLSANPAWPKAATSVLSSCTVADAGCTVAVNVGSVVTNVTHKVAVGTYLVSFSSRTNGVYTPIAQSHSSSVFCVTHSFSATDFVVECRDHANTLTDAIFSVVFVDNDNT